MQTQGLLFFFPVDPAKGIIIGGGEGGRECKRRRRGVKMIMYAARCEEASERDEARTCVGQVSVPPSVGVHSSLHELRVGCANFARHSRKL